jgi:hypothetical protein
MCFFKNMNWQVLKTSEFLGKSHFQSSPFRASSTLISSLTIFKSFVNYNSSPSKTCADGFYGAWPYKWTLIRVLEGSISKAGPQVQRPWHKGVWFWRQHLQLPFPVSQNAISKIQSNAMEPPVREGACICEGQSVKTVGKCACIPWIWSRVFFLAWCGSSVNCLLSIYWIFTTHSFLWTWSQILVQTYFCHCSL